MRRILFAIIVTMVFTSCSKIVASKSYEGDTYSRDFINLEMVTDRFLDDGGVYRDTFTDVLYYVSTGDQSSFVTPIAKADGSFLTYTEWKERQKNN